MELEQRLERVAVIGAAGKMGSGIASLLAQEIAFLKAKPENRNRVYRLYLIDVNESALDGLLQYLKSQVQKAAEKSIVKLRELYASDATLVENQDVIDYFMGTLPTFIRAGTDIAIAKDSHVVFEVVLESQDLKISIYKNLARLCSNDTFFLTNTSSIPIHVLDKEAGLGGRIIGYHFYNPPIVQKLVELIQSKSTAPDLVGFSKELGIRLKKKLIPANDIAGFIGNGHFMRDALHAASEVKALSSELTQTGAIYAMNRVSQDFMVRPMGIFQLLDYVGLDVCQGILKVMSQYTGETLKSELIDRMIEKKVLGGQRSDGSQKDGFLKYDRNRPAGIYDIDKGEYVSLDKDGKMPDIDKKLGDFPQGYAPWKALLSDPKKDEKLAAYFKNLAKLETLGARLAISYMKRSREIAEKLVRDGVANSAEDVNGVLTNGFYHLYGPVNNYIV